MRTLAENKADLIAAHRSKKWALAKRLSAERQRLKRIAARKCADCGIPIAVGAERCFMHAIAHKSYRNALLSICALLFALGCKTPPPSPPAPNAMGCSCTISALGNSLVSAMNWTNPVTGHTGTGSTAIYPEFGSTFNVYVDPSISCATNLPWVAAATYKCNGTNMPFAQPLALPADCNGFQGFVIGDCWHCAFYASVTEGFSCSIFSPKK